jgi:hypothetical protein
MAFMPSAFYDPNSHLSAIEPSTGMAVFPNFTFADMIPGGGIAPNMLYTEPEGKVVNEVPTPTPAYFTQQSESSFSVHTQPSYQIPRGLQQPRTDNEVEFDFSYLDTAMMDVTNGLSGFAVVLDPDPIPVKQLAANQDPTSASVSGSGSGSSPYSDATTAAGLYNRNSSGNPSTDDTSPDGTNPTNYPGGPVHTTRFLNKPPVQTQQEGGNVASSINTPSTKRSRMHSDFRTARHPTGPEVDEATGRDWREFSILGNGGMNDPNDIPPQARDHL